MLESSDFYECENSGGVALHSVSGWMETKILNESFPIFFPQDFLAY